MELSGIQTISAARQSVWRALDDPVVLAQCVSGSDSFEQTGPGIYSAIAAVKLGPIRSRITVNITITRREPPRLAVLTIHAKGKIGSAEAVVRLALEEIDCGTSLNYDAQVNFGGQLGHFAKRWGRDAAQELVGEFLQRFAAAVPPETVVPHTESPVIDSVRPPYVPPVPPPTSRKKALWIGVGAAAGAVVTTVAAVLLTRRGSR